MPKTPTTKVGMLGEFMRLGEKKSNAGSSPIEKMNTDQFSKICEEIKRGDQDYSNKQIRNEGAPGKCKRLIKGGVDPKELLTKLEESLGEEYYNNYTQNFLPALLKEITQSEKLGQIKKTEVERIIMKLITDAFSKNSNGQTSRYSVETSKLSNGSGLDSVVSSPRTSEESSRSPISRSSSVSSILSYAGESSYQKAEETDQEQPEQNGTEEPEVQESKNPGDQVDPGQVEGESRQVSLQRVTKAGEEESKIPVSRTEMTDDDHTKDLVKSEEKKDKKNAAPIVQEPSASEKKGEDIPLKQPNNRNLHVALVAGCALSTIGCIVAGAMTSGLGLFAMAAAFAIATAVTWHLTPSSELTSTNLSPLVDSQQR